MISSELFNRILFNRLKFPSSYHFLFSCRGLTRYLNVLLRVRRHQRNNETVPVIFEQNVKKHPNKVCFIFEGREYTFKEVNRDFKLLLFKSYFIFIFILDQRIEQSSCTCLRRGWLQTWRYGCPSHGKPSRIRSSMVGFIQSRYCHCPHQLQPSRQTALALCQYYRQQSHHFQLRF